MKTNGALWILAAVILPSCLVYNEKLIDEAGAGSATASGGAVMGTGGAEVGSGGTDPGSGGVVGTGGDDPLATGAMNSGGGGDTGTGGEPPYVGLCEGHCVDRMNHLASGVGWANPAGGTNLAVNWRTYDDKSPEGVWVRPGNPSTDFMSPRADHPEPEGLSEKQLTVETTGFSDWGIGVHVNLNQDGAAFVDLSAPTVFTGIQFYVKLGEGGHPALHVSIEDKNSTGNGMHPRTITPVFMTSEWTLVQLPFETSFDATVATDAVYSIHFTVDSDSSTTEKVSYALDDLSFYQ